MPQGHLGEIIQLDWDGLEVVMRQIPKPAKQVVTLLVADSQGRATIVSRVRENLLPVNLGNEDDGNSEIAVKRCLSSVSEVHFNGSFNL